MILNWSTGLNVERLNLGKPLITADRNGWDSGYTLNPTAIHLERSHHNDEIIRNLLGDRILTDSRIQSGIVAVFYRGIPRQIPGLPALRSSVGLAVFTPDLELLKRFPYPVMVPTDDPMGWDYNGVEDQRITRIGDKFYMVYCGYNPRLPRRHNIHICMAESTDLVHWTKLGPVSGSVNDVPNKDAVILPEPVNGWYVMLHRPCVGGQGKMSIALAVSDTPTGPWHNLGTIMRAIKNPIYSSSWVGAGSAPIPLGNNRFLADYHTGNYYSTGARDYFAGYAILDFNRFDIKCPGAIVESRCECVLAPETPYELNSPWPHNKTLNCVFPCGSYEQNNDIVLVYGGADAYVLAAKFNKLEMLTQLEKLSCHCKPYTYSLPERIRNRFSGRVLEGIRKSKPVRSELVDDVR